MNQKAKVGHFAVGGVIKMAGLILIMVITAALSACGDNAGTQGSSSSGGSVAISGAADGNSGAAAEAKKAGDFPNKTIRIYIPYSAGGAADLSVRALQPKLEEELGVSVEVVAKPGGGGALAMNEVINSKPDGYTLGFTGVGPAIVTPIANDVGYTPADFDTVAAHIDIPYVVAVQASSPYETLQQLLDDIQANPHKVRIGSPGPTSTTFVALDDLRESQSLQFQSVPFNGGVDTINALLGSNLEAIVNVDSELRAYIDDGTFRILTVLSDNRSFVSPETLTSAEQGIDFTIKNAPPSGLYAPKGTPPEIIALLERAVKAATEDEAVKERFNNLSIAPAYSTAADFRVALDESYVYYQEKLKP